MEILKNLLKINGNDKKHNNSNISSSQQIESDYADGSVLNQSVTQSSNKVYKMKEENELEVTCEQLSVSISIFILTFFIHDTRKKYLFVRMKF